MCVCVCEIEDWQVCNKDISTHTRHVSLLRNSFCKKPFLVEEDSYAAQSRRPLFQNLNEILLNNGENDRDKRLENIIDLSSVLRA